MYLSLKTTGSVQGRSARLAGPFAWLAVPVVAGFAIWTQVQSGRGVIPAPLEVGAFLLMVAAAWAIRDGHPAWGFAATTAGIAAVMASFWVALYPNVMVSSTNPAYNLTVANSASSHYALTLMTIVAGVFTPLILAYQGWSYHVFRARITAPAATAPAASQPEPAATDAG
jgi:cytochrome d ubiquinol oxidase subunit II